MSATTAIAGTRVIELREDEIATIADALDASGKTVDIKLAARIADGDEYANEADEYARLTLRDRRLKTERSAIGRRLAELEQALIEDMTEMGVDSLKHAATGKTIRIDSKLWAKYEFEGEKPTDEERAAAGQALIASGLDQYVVPSFNTNSVSAYFREQLKAWKAEQADLPEHERSPLTDDVLRSFLPDGMQDLWRLDNTPTLVVR